MAVKSGLSMENITLSPDHPYYPVTIEVVGYLANELSVPVLLGIFAAGCAAVVGATLLIVRAVHPRLSGADKGAIMWFIISGAIHLFFEGYFSLNHASMGPGQHLFGQWWKEYAHSDSRYLTSDPFVLCMETVTAFLWGPLCFVVAYMILVAHPLRMPLQAIVSVGQIYGDILYYATSMFDLYHKNISYCRPEGFYFWGYYVFMNFIWIVIPGVLLYDSVETTANAFKALQSSTKSLNGSAKKTL